jgi:hypothetical protein
MSRSNPTPTNPAQHFFTWSGSKGQLEFYDKEKQERVKVPLPFEFMVLDELNTITGFCEQDSSSYWSNEVRSTTRDELIVKTSRGTKQVGLYKDLTDVRSKGAKYAKSIYIAHKNKAGEYIIGNIKASGAALTAWIELSSKYITQNGKIRLTGSIEGKKGATTYQIPTFEYDHIDSDENKIAIELDKELQVYLSQYLSAPKFDEHVDEEIDPELGKATLEQQADYERRKAAAKEPKLDLSDSAEDNIHVHNPMNPQEEDAVVEDLGNEINLDDIPF